MTIQEKDIADLSIYRVILILGVYFGGFLLYNRFVLKKRGKEQLPPMGPTIVDAWSFIKDMVIIGGVTIADKVKGVLGRSRPGGFQGLPTDER